MSPYLIFDFDGVFADSWDLLVKFQMNYEGKTAEQIRQQYFNFFLKPMHSNRDDFNEAKQMKQQIFLDAIIPHHGTNIFPLFQGFVDEIIKISTDYRAVVSSGSTKYVVPTLATTPLTFSHILGFEDHHSKEEKISLICKEWGVSPQDVYYFTDTVSDVVELRDYIDPTKIIGCSWGFHGYETLSTVLPKEQILVEFGDVRNILG
jgi:hypothetical protein